MKLSKLWIVTKPTPYSELGDIFFDATMRDLYYQFHGGLEPHHIHGVYTEPEEARQEAERLLAERPEN